jgi:signal transduction histidine kinase
MIAQRLNKEFTVSQHQTEYNEITGLLRSDDNRINKIITQFLNYANPLDVKFADVDLKMFFDEIKHLFEEQAKQKNINFIISGDDSQMFVFDADLIKQALMNIIQNAFDAVSENGEVKINYKVESNKLLINIKDNGPGIHPDTQKRIFDLYFTTRKDGNGLGLSIAQKIIAQHNGSIQLSSNVNKGTFFKIILAGK